MKMRRSYEYLYTIGHPECEYSFANEVLPEKIDEEYVRKLHERCVESYKEFENWRKSLPWNQPWNPAESSPPPTPFHQSFESQFEDENLSVDNEWETEYDFTRPSPSNSESEGMEVEVIRNVSSESEENVNISSFFRMNNSTNSQESQSERSSKKSLRRRSERFCHPIDANFSDDEEQPSIPDNPKKAEKIILQLCKQNACLSFSEAFPDNYLDHCRKIDEGCSSEVFRYSKNSEISVLKIIPVGGTKLYNNSPQEELSTVSTEMIISKEADNLRSGSIYRTSGFINLKEIKFLHGKYPDQLVKEWEKYTLRGKESENDCPRNFDEDQQYIAFEFGDGGLPLDQFSFYDASQTYSAFMQIALTLAVAEKAFEFEHRDLHLGNVLTSKTSKDKVHFKFGDLTIQCLTQGIQITIIDYTLSRMTYKNHVLFGDLGQDSLLFQGIDDYQFDVYRFMRVEVDDDWKRYVPRTNILWLDYLLKKLTDLDSEIIYCCDTSDQHKRALAGLKTLQKEILSYDSAFDFVMTSEKTKGLKCLYNRC